MCFGDLLNWCHHKFIPWFKYMYIWISLITGNTVPNCFVVDLNLYYYIFIIILFLDKLWWSTTQRELLVTMKCMTWFMVDTCTLIMYVWSHNSELAKTFNTANTSHMQNSAFVILTNDFSLKYTTSQTATALLPPIMHINSLMMWPKIRWGQEKMLLSTSAELVGIVQRHSSPIKTNSALSLRKTLNKHLVLI